MKKKLLSLILSGIIVLSLVACSSTEAVATQPAADEPEEATVEEEIDENEFIDEDIIDDETLEENIDEAGEEEADFEALYDKLYATYRDYLESGYEPEGGNFASPVSQTLYLAPSFTLCDANGDNYDDVIVYGELGLRDKKICEVYFYNEEDDSFYVNELDGYVEALAESSVLVRDIDRDVQDPIYYDYYSVYKLTPNGPEKVLAHNSTDNDGTVTDTYYEGENEITEAEYKEAFAKYEEALISLDGCYNPIDSGDFSNYFNE